MKQFPYQSAQIEYELWKSGNRIRTWWYKLLRRPTTILYIQGFRNPYQNSAQLLTELSSQGFNVYSLNFPGHGNSTRLDKISWELLGDIIQMFVHNQNLGKVVLIGYSMGGGLALKLIEKHPKWLSKAILIAPFCAPLGLADLKHAFGYIEEFFKDYLSTTTETPPVLDLDQTYLFRHYSPIFLQYAFDAEKVNSSKHNISVFLNMHDGVSLPGSIKQSLNTLKNIKFVEMTEIGHDLHYITHTQLKEYVSAIIKQIN